MKVRVQERTEIRKPPSDVYRFIATEHGRNHPRWDPRAVEFMQLDPGPVSVGTRFSYRRKVLGRLQTLQLVVTDMEPNRKFAFRVTGSMQAQISYILDSTGDPSTTVVQGVADFEVSGPQLLAPLVKMVVDRGAKDSQRRIKQMVEAGALA